MNRKVLARKLVGDEPAKRARNERTFENLPGEIPGVHHQQQFEVELSHEETMLASLANSSVPPSTTVLDENGVVTITVWQIQYRGKKSCIIKTIDRFTPVQRTPVQRTPEQRTPEQEQLELQLEEVPQDRLVFEFPLVAQEWQPMPTVFYDEEENKLVEIYPRDVGYGSMMDAIQDVEREIQREEMQRQLELFPLPSYEIVDRTREMEEMEREQLGPYMLMLIQGIANGFTALMYNQLIEGEYKGTFQGVYYYIRIRQITFQAFELFYEKTDGFLILERNTKVFLPSEQREAKLEKRPARKLKEKINDIAKYRTSRNQTVVTGVMGIYNLLRGVRGRGQPLSEKKAIVRRYYMTVYALLVSTPIVAEIHQRINSDDIGIMLYDYMAILSKGDYAKYFEMVTERARHLMGHIAFTTRLITWNLIKKNERPLDPPEAYLEVMHWFQEAELKLNNQFYNLVAYPVDVEQGEQEELEEFNNRFLMFWTSETLLQQHPRDVSAFIRLSIEIGDFIQSLRIDAISMQETLSAQLTVLIEHAIEAEDKSVGIALAQWMEKYKPVFEKGMLQNARINGIYAEHYKRNPDIEYSETVSEMKNTLAKQILLDINRLPHQVRRNFLRALDPQAIVNDVVDTRRIANIAGRETEFLLYAYDPNRLESRSIIPIPLEVEPVELNVNQLHVTMDLDKVNEKIQTLTREWVEKGTTRKQKTASERVSRNKDLRTQIINIIAHTQIQLNVDAVMRDSRLANEMYTLYVEKRFEELERLMYTHQQEYTRTIPNAEQTSLRVQGHNAPVFRASNWSDIFPGMRAPRAPIVVQLPQVGANDASAEQMTNIYEIADE